jgi:hypothetical protein
MRFSKTQIIGGLRCSKQLHLSVHHPERAHIVNKPATVTGEVVEEHARREFPGAVLVPRGPGAPDPFAATRRLLADPTVTTVFEAGVEDDNLALFVDVLSRQGDGWKLTEIKAATRIKDSHIDDVAIQALALRRAAIPVRRFELMHVNSEFVYRGGHDYEGLFVREDITERVLGHVAAIETDLQHLKDIPGGPQPERHLGSHCKHPYPCPYIRYCESTDAPYPVAWLPQGHRIAETLIARGIFDIRDVPIDALSSEEHLRVRRLTIAGTPELLPGAAELLGELGHPRYYLDFECIQYAIPIWEGTSPYAQLPFQWSCHFEYADGRIEHREFLETSGSNPRRAFAESLIEACSGTGPVIVYNAAFEKRILRETAEVFPDLAPALAAIAGRIFDLYPVVKKNYYHPQMKGSWSIKKVLPALVPELDYGALGEVQDGTEAQSAFFRLINGDVGERDRQRLRADLVSYCRLDTLAMVRIVEALCRPVRAKT